MRDHIRIRRFLNHPTHHAGAYVYAVVSDTSTCRESGCNHRWCGYIELRLADCDRVVSFDFDVATSADRRNSLHKIDVLLDALTRFREALTIEAEYASERSRRDSTRRQTSER